MMIAQTATDHPTVLVVARGRRYGAFLRQALAGAGYAVDLAHDPVRGLERALAGGVDLVVLQQHQADAASVQWCRRLAVRSGGRYLPVLLLAERARGAPLAAGRAAGVAAHLTRPLDVPELLRQVRIWTATRARLRAFYTRLLRAADAPPEATCA